MHLTATMALGMLMLKKLLRTFNYSEPQHKYNYPKNYLMKLGILSKEILNLFLLN